ncbi:MAG: hypothetical protein AAF086_07925 [Planctomycetota bacterium]
MKVLVVLLVLVVALVALVVKFGGVLSFDPAAGAQQFVTDVQPGMTWQQVVAVKAPKKYAAYKDDPESMMGHGPIVKFDEARFASNMQSGSFPLGFFFEYTFDAEHAYNVSFDGQGNVTSIEERMTTSDLLGY